MQLSMHLLPKPFWKTPPEAKAAGPQGAPQGQGAPDPNQPVPIADVHLTAAVEGKAQSTDIPVGVAPKGETIPLGNSPKDAIAAALKVTGKDGSMAVFGTEKGFVGKQAILDPKVAALLVAEQPPKDVKFDLFKLVPEAQALVIGQKVLALADPPQQEGAPQGAPPPPAKK
jgi:hypothetical protein